MSLLLLLKSGVAAPPPTPVATVNPTPILEIDFLGNPTATYGDIHTTADGSVSFWRMNSASTFLDERLANNGSILGSPTLVSGPYPYDSNQALSFNGTTDSAYVLSSPSLSTKSQFSIDGWVKVSSLPGSTVDLAAKQGSWRLQLNSSGKLVWTLKDDISTVTVTSNTILATATWYHVTGVYDDTQALVYINGVLDSVGTYSSGVGLEGQPLRFAGSLATTAPTWQSVQTNTSTSSTTITCTKPTSTATGDLLVAHFMANGALASTLTSTPTGWVQAAHDDPAVTGRSHSCVFTKIATASEPASYIWTTSTPVDYAIAISRITGQDPITPYGAFFGNIQTASTTTHATGAHLASTENVMVVAMFSSRGAATFTESSGTERYDVASLNAVAGCTQTQASPSSLDVTGTSSVANAGCSYWLAINGSGVNETACTLDDWTYWNRALTASEASRNYYSKDSGVGTWTDVSTFARDSDFSVAGAARQYELDTMESQPISVLLKDPNRYFDPANASSIYYPNVVPMRKIRGRTNYQSTAYDLFYAYIERWPPQNFVIGYQEIGITAVDGFDALAQADVSGEIPVGFSGAQINVLLDKALWPKTARAIDQGQYIMASQTLTSTKALGAIQEIAASERGIFFIDQSGIATFHDAAHRGSFSRSTQSQVTFTDNHSATGIFYQSIAPSFDRDKLVNDWVVSPDSSTFGAADQEQEDAASVSRYWRRSSSRSTRLISNADAYSQAGNLLNDTSQPALRFDSLTVLPTTTTAYQACLGLSISDRVTVIRGNNPGWDGDVITKDCFIEARRINVTANGPWAFTFQLSPASLGNYRATIVRDGPVSYWRMDTVA